MNVAALEKQAGEPSDPVETVARPSARRPPSKRLVLTLMIAALGAFGLYFIHWVTTGRFIESTNNAYLRADQVAMAPRVSGYVSDVYVIDNQDVVVGQPLLKIDPRRYDAAVRQAQATVETRQADVAKCEADLQLQDAIIAQAQADAGNAGANAEFAQREFARIASLSHQGVVSRQKSDQLSNALAQARALKASKDAALDAARKQVATLTAQLDQARAQGVAAKETVQEAELDLADTVLRSPVAGRIGDRNVRVGQFVQPGLRLLSVVPTAGLYLIANFKETQIRGMRVGQPVVIRVDAYPDLSLEGIVESFAPGTGAQFALLPPENATGNFTKIVQRVPVRIRIATSSGRTVLVPGLSADVSVNTKPDKRVKRAAAE